MNFNNSYNFEHFLASLDEFYFYNLIDLHILIFIPNLILTSKLKFTDYFIVNFPKKKLLKEWIIKYRILSCYYILVLV